jgi:hypothetical protein
MGMGRSQDVVAARRGALEDCTGTLDRALEQIAAEANSASEAVGACVTLASS